VIAGEDVKRVKFYLHGSFSKTYRGHGTDRALLAGVLGMLPDDEGLADSQNMAPELGVEFSFEPADLGDVHPNTVKMEIQNSSGKVSTIVGSSTGGGSVVITEIDGMQVEFTGDYNTLIAMHHDRPGIISRVTNALASYDVNIAFMRVYRRERGSDACMIIEADQPIPEELIHYLRAMPGIERAMVVPAMQGGSQV
jgi:L-serine dehydratase